MIRDEIRMVADELRAKNRADLAEELTSSIRNNWIGSRSSQSADYKMAMSFISAYKGIAEAI